MAYLLHLPLQMPDHCIHFMVSGITVLPGSDVCSVVCGENLSSIAACQPEDSP